MKQSIKSCLAKAEKAKMTTIALEAASPASKNWNAELSFEIKLKAIGEFYEAL